MDRIESRGAESALIAIDDRVCASSRNVVREIVEASGRFTDEEVNLAVELVDDYLSRGKASGYDFLFARCGGGCAGFACFGRIPATRSSYDLYWIAVHPAFQRRGVGRHLLTAVESAVVRDGGSRIYLDTSGSAAYEQARGFYEATGYRREAVLADFYAPGDDKVIFAKELVATGDG